MIRRFGKIAVYLALLLLGMLCLGYFTVVNPLYEPLRAPLVRTVTRLISQSLHGTLEIGALRGSLFSAPVLHNVVLRDAQGRVVGQIEAIRLTYDLTTLLRRRLAVHTVEIIRPQLHVAQEPDGRLNLLTLLPASSPPTAEKPAAGGGLPVAVSLDTVQIHDGQLTLDLPALPGVRQVDALQVRLRVQIDQDGIQAHVQQGTARMSPAAVELRTVQGALQMRGDVMQINDVRLQTEDTLITAQGVLPGGTAPADFTLQMQPLALAEIGRLLHNDMLRDALHLRLQAAGPPGALRLQGQLRTPAARVDLQGQLNTAATPLQYSAQLGVSHVNLAALVGQADLQSDINLQLHVEGEGVTLQELRSVLQLDVQESHLGSLVIRPSVIHLEAAHQRVQVQRVDLHTSAARLTASGALDLAGTAHVEYEVTSDLASVRQLLGTQELDGTLQLRGQARGAWPALSAQGTLEAHNLLYQGHRLQALHLAYDGSQLGAQPQVTAQLRAQQVQAGGMSVEQISLDTTHQGTARQVRFALDVRQTAETGGKTHGFLTLGDTAQQLVLEEVLVQLPQRLWRSVAPLRVAFGAQGLHLQHIQLAHEEESITLAGAVADARLQDVALHIAQLDLAYLQRLFHLPEALGGRATVHVRLSGPLADPQLQGDITLRSAPQQLLPFEQLRTTLTYAQQHFQGAVQLQQGNREVLVLDLRLPIDLALTNVPLGQRLLDAPVEVRLNLKQPNLAARREGQPSLPPLAGTLQGTVDVRGTYAALTLDAELQLQQLGVVGVVEHLQGPVRLTGALVTAASVPAFAQSLQQGAVQAHLQNLALRIPALRGDLPTQGAAPQPFQVQDVILQATAQWSPAGLQATLQRLHVQTTGFGLPRTDVLLEAQLTPQRLDVSRLQVRFPQSEIRVQGSLALPTQQFQVRCDIPRLQLTDLPLAFPPDLPQVLQGVLTAHGSVQAPQVTVDLRYAGGHIGADLAAQWQEPVPRYQATLHLKGLDMAQLLPRSQGRLHASARLQGTGVTVEQRQATFDMSVDTDGLNLAPGLTARVQASLVGDTLEVPRLHVRSTPLEFMANGTFSMTKQTALDYRVTLGDLQPLGQYLGLVLQGRGGLTGKLQGTRGALQTQATLQLNDGRIAALSIQRVQADFAATQLLTAPQATLKARVSDLQGPSLLPTSLTLDVSRTPQQGTFTLGVTKGPYEKSALAGTIIPTAEAQRLTLQTVRLHHRTLAWENAGPVELVRQQQGQIQIQHLAMRSGSQAVTVQGSIVPNGAVQADVEFRAVQIRPTVQAFAPTAAVPDGRLQLRVALRGTVQQPQIQGDLQLTALQWQQQQLGDIHATLGMNGETMRTDLRWQEQGRQLLHFYGTAGLGAQAALDLHLQAPAFDLARLSSMSPAVQQSAGVLGLDLHVSGTQQTPQIRGQLTLQDGALQLAATGEQYRDMQVRMLLGSDRLEVAQFHMRSRSGPLQISGYIQHADLALRHVDLTVRAQQFTAMHTPGIEAVIAADLHLHGPHDALTVDGTVSVPRARIVIKSLPGSGPQVVEPWELTVPGVYGRQRKGAATARSTPAAQSETPDLLSSLHANLALEIPKNVWVQGPGTAVEMRGALQVTKKRLEPFIVSGTVETARGFASFYGKKFVLTQGQVTFTGSPEINPLLDVTVTRKVSDYLVAIHAGGKAQQPEIALSSTPPLEQVDILSLLVIGKTTDKLTNAEQGSLSKQAQQIAGGAVSSQLESAAGEALGLDTVELSTESAKVGRYVTQDLFLSYERGLGGKDNGNTVGVEYSLSRRVKFKGSSNDTGETALDLFWRLDY